MAWKKLDIFDKTMTKLLRKPPAKGDYWFTGTIEENGQKRGLYYAKYGLLISLFLSVIGQVLPTFFGYRPVSFLWLFTGFFASGVVLFWLSLQAILLQGGKLLAFQKLAGIGSFTAFLLIFVIIGGAIPSYREWWQLVLDQPDAKSLVVAAGIFGVLLGWLTHTKYPFRGIIVAGFLVFTAVWMDFQGYYVVALQEAAPSNHIYGYDTKRLEYLPKDDGGTAFAMMFFTYSAALVPMMLWVFIKQFRARSRD